MKVIVILVALATATILHSQELPDAPKPHTGYAGQKWILVGIGVARAADWMATQRCVSQPWAICHEKQLPQALAKSPVGLAVFEAGMTGLQWYASRRLSRRHPSLARIADTVSLGAISGTVGLTFARKF